MSRRDTIVLWIMTSYLAVINLVFAFVAWTLWIWRDGLMTPEETTQVMLEPLMMLGPFAVAIDVLFAIWFARWVRRRTEGHSSSSAGE